VTAQRAMSAADTIPVTVRVFIDSLPCRTS
jgi:hypothetical protein